MTMEPRTIDASIIELPDGTRHKVQGTLTRKPNGVTCIYARIVIGRQTRVVMIAGPKCEAKIVAYECEQL